MSKTDKIYPTSNILMEQFSIHRSALRWVRWEDTTVEISMANMKPQWGMRSAALVKLPDNYINADVKLCWIQHQLESHNYFNTDKHVCLR